MSNKYAVIMAGGYGERFWPLSTKSKPKQLLDLVGDIPLITQAVNRISNIIPLDNILIITNNDLVDSISKVIPNIPLNNIIGEPLARDTATAISTAASIIKYKNSDAVFCVLTADHIIGDNKNFSDTINKSLDLAYKENILITIGIKPTFPSTGFGYIKINDYFKDYKNYYNTDIFLEKPNKENANKYINDNQYYWNSGMFIWSLKVFEKSLNKFSSSHFKHLNSLYEYLKKDELTKGMNVLYPRQNKISIDYALMEKADNVILIPSTFSWDDVGSWNALENHFNQDEYQNTIIGNANILNSNRNIVYSKERSVALIGVDDLVIVEAENSILVCKKDNTEQIKILLNNNKLKKTSS